MIIRRWIAAAMLVAASSVPAAELEILRVGKISTSARHSAFTGLARFNDVFYCAWREGSNHVSGDGKLRVVRSVDGTNWTPVALMTRAGADLRDAKLTVTQDKRLMLHGIEKFPDRSSPLRRNIAWFTTDGTTWTDPVTIAEDDIWFWKHTWHKGTGYGVGYACAPPYFTRLYTSMDAKKWTTHVATLNNSGYVNESSIVFMPDDTAHCLLRRDDGTRTSLLGTAAPPYTSWTWQDLGRQIGGPEMIRLPDNRLLAAVRQHPQATWLCWISPKSGTLTPALKLPSGGDTSYAGMVWHDGRLWVSYYSSHEKRTSVYIAEVAYRPTINIGTRRELFVDHFLVDSLRNAGFVLQTPVDRGVVFRFDRPWEGMVSTYVTVIHDGSLFRMYYRGQPTENMADSVSAVLSTWTANLRAENHPDVLTIAPDLENPAIIAGDPAPGKMVLQFLPAYAGTEVAHALYLPADWAPGKRFPVLIEYCGNGSRVRDGNRIGYGITGGKGFIWAVLPFVSQDHKRDLDLWWGDVAATVAYAKEAVPALCRQWGGDPAQIILVGHSRGAIACNYIGLHDDGIAKLWRAMIPFSHYDDGHEAWGMTPEEQRRAPERLRRLGSIPQFICGEHTAKSRQYGEASALAAIKEKNLTTFTDAKKELGLVPLTEAEGTRQFIAKHHPGKNYTIVDLPCVNHTAKFVLRDTPARQQLREWLNNVLRSTPAR